MKLLLAEDERGLARALTAILRHDAYEVDVAEDGNSALTSMLEGSYDAAIIDIMMPGLDGLSVLRRVRAAGARTPVILLTARSEVDDKVEGLDAGANDYLTKPFSAKELLARIRVLTRATTALDARALAFGDIRLDLASCRLTGPQGSVDLTRREFALMRLLMAHPGVRYPTERLLTGVWGDGADEDLSVVWVHLSNLRKRLREIGSTVSISLDRLFERFFRPDASRSSDTGGSGIGLSIVRAVAEAHRGTATVRAQGDTIVFTVRIPRWRGGWRAGASAVCGRVPVALRARDHLSYAFLMAG